MSRTSNDRSRERARQYYYDNREARKEACRQYQLDYPERALWRRARQRAKEKGLPFTIIPEDIVIPSVCPVLSLPLEVGEGQQTDASPSLDRIIPSRGYVPGNIAVISNKANRLKSNGTPEEIGLVALYAYEMTDLATYGRRRKI